MLDSDKKPVLMQSEVIEGNMGGVNVNRLRMGVALSSFLALAGCASTSVDKNQIIGDEQINEYGGEVKPQSIIMTVMQVIEYLKMRESAKREARDVYSILTGYLETEEKEREMKE